MKPTAHAYGETRAFAGQGADLHATGGVTIAAHATTSATAIAKAGGIGAISGGFLETDADAGGVVEAYIGQRSTSASSALTTVNAGGGTITLTADASMSSTAETHGFSGGIVTITDMKPDANVSGRTSAYVRDNVDIDAGTLTLSAGTSGDRTYYQATSTAFTFSIGLAGGGGVVPTAHTTGTIEAFLGAPAGITGVNGSDSLVDVSGTLTAEAWSTLGATAEARGTQAGAMEANLQNATATVGGTTRAYAGDGTDVQAGSLVINANGNATAGATTKSVSVTLGGLNGAFATATVSTKTDAYLGKNADATPNSVFVTVTLAGPATLTAGGTNIANATATGDTLAAADVSLLFPTASVNGATRAYVGPETSVTGSSLSATADSTSNSNAHADVASISFLLSVTLVHGTAQAARTTDAFVGQKSSLSLTGGAAFTAMSNTTPHVDTHTVSLSTIKVGIYDLTATSTTQKIFSATEMRFFPAEKMFCETKKIFFRRDPIFLGYEKIFSGTIPLFSFIEAILFIAEKINFAMKTHFCGTEKIFSAFDTSFFASEMIFSTSEKTAIANHYSSFVGCRDRMLCPYPVSKCSLAILPFSL